jgi:hypothetical protein
MPTIPTSTPATPATAEKGRYVLDYAVRRVAEAIAAVKADTKALGFLKDYYRRGAEMQ